MQIIAILRKFKQILGAQYNELKKRTYLYFNTIAF